MNFVLQLQARVAALLRAHTYFRGMDDATIITEAVAFEPQANTTWATNLAAYKLWKDHENRQAGSRRKRGYQFRASG